MDFNIGIEDVGLAVLQELWNKVIFQAIALVNETKDVMLEKESFLKFSRNIYDLNIVLQALNIKKVEAALGSQSTKAKLDNLNSLLTKALHIIKDYKSGSRLRLLLHSNSVLLQMQDLAKQIANTISSFELVNLDIALNLKTMTYLAVQNLWSMEFRAAIATESIASEIEYSITQDSRNREHALKLLEKIAQAVGASENITLVQDELALLKQEKEEMEVQKKQAEAFQLSQLIQLLYSTEIVANPQDEEIDTYHQKYPISSFLCPLCNEFMTDPVAIFCGHSFERKAITEYLERGEKKCPTCNEELESLDLTPNVNLRSSIQEWKQRDMALTFQAAVSGITCNNHSRQNKALEDLLLLMEAPQYVAKVAEANLISKLVEFLKDDAINRKAALKCLYHVAMDSDNYKEAIAEAGAIRHIVKHICKGETGTDAMALLLELSKNETLGERIGNMNHCIPLLVSLLSNENPVVSQKAQNVLQNLASNTHFVVKMAEVGHFHPFVARFNQGPQETRTLMTAALVRMPIRDSGIKELKDKQFIHNLIDMLSSNTPLCKSACLKCIKKLIPHSKMVKLFLSDPLTIPLLLGLVSLLRSDPHLKQEAAEILALLVEACKHPHFQRYQGLSELQSEHNVNLFLQLVSSSDPQTKVQFVHLLIELSNKSKTAKNLIRSNNDAITDLFCALHDDQHVVRKWAMKLMYCISVDHPDGVPLPPSPGKETAINTLAAILTCSLDIEERSAAAGIISQLPKDDITIDEILCKSDTLKAIHEVICCMDVECNGIKAPTNQDTSLLENSLAALLRFTEPSKPELQRQLGKLELYPSLVRVLSTGSSLAKQRTAIALAQLSQSTNQTLFNAMKPVKGSVPVLNMSKFFPAMSWCCSGTLENESLCRVHGAACSLTHAFCLVKADAVKPLVKTLSDEESGVAEAALMALETLLIDHNTLSNATAAFVDSQGVVAILQVLEKGSFSAKAKALDLFQKVLEHTRIADPLFQRLERILIQLLSDDGLKKKAALVLRQMNIIPEQSSYF